MIRASICAAIVLVTGSAVSACSGDSSTRETVTVTSPAASSQSPTASAPLPAAPTQSTAPESWTMPDLIGRNLQDAQDAMQSVTGNPIFQSSSTDLTGQGRNQIMDANWQVCTSTPAPGETFSSGTLVEFGVVRIDTETCP